MPGWVDQCCPPRFKAMCCKCLRLRLPGPPHTDALPSAPAAAVAAAKAVKAEPVKSEPQGGPPAPAATAHSNGGEEEGDAIKGALLESLQEEAGELNGSPYCSE